MVANERWSVLFVRFVFRWSRWLLMWRRLRSARGQAFVETMVMMPFMLLLVFGFVHMTMLIATKYVTNYAAFAAARTAMVSDPLDVLTGNVSTAATEVIQNMNWQASPVECTLFGSGDCAVFFPAVRMVEGMFGIPTNRTGLEVRYRAPFGLPIFNAVPAGGLQVIGFAPVALQPSVENTGDNEDKLSLDAWF